MVAPAKPRSSHACPPPWVENAIMVLNIVLEPSEEGGYTATVPALPGCISEGDTIEEAMANIREAIELCVEVAEEMEARREGILVRELTL